MRKLNDLNHDERPFIGKVSPTMGGAYSAGQTYAALTFVENDGSLYISLQTAYGIEPGVSANWEQYWMLCASRGEKGDTGDGLKILGHYDTLQALQQAVPNPAAGDAYSIGTSAAVSVIANLELSGSVITVGFPTPAVNSPTFTLDAKFESDSLLVYARSFRVPNS